MAAAGRRRVRAESPASEHEPTGAVGVVVGLVVAAEMTGRRDVGHVARSSLTSWPRAVFTAEATSPRWASEATLTCTAPSAVGTIRAARPPAAPAAAAAPTADATPEANDCPALAPAPLRSAWAPFTAALPSPAAACETRGMADVTPPA